MDIKDEGLLTQEHSLTTSSDRKSAEKLGRCQKSNKIQKRASTDKRCTSCGTTSTPVWRWGGEAKEVLLCNACSLRIRRSATRPQRAKSPADISSQKQSPVLTSGGSGSPNTNRLGELGPADAEALRVELLRCVEFHLGLEKARLLGPREAALAGEDWQGTQRARTPFNNACSDLPGSSGAQLGYGDRFHSGQQAYHMPEPLRIDSRLAYSANDARHIHLI